MKKPSKKTKDTKPAGKKTAGEKYPCPCCGAKGLSSRGAYEICSKCQWEDDPVQAKDLDFKGGANPLSLHQARAQQLRLKRKS